MRRGKGAGNGDDAEDLGAGAGLELAFVAQQESEAEGLVEDAGEGVRGVEGDGGEERVDLLLEELDGELAVGLAELLPAEDADAGALELGDEAVVPAGALIVDEWWRRSRRRSRRSLLGEAAGVERVGAG